MKYEEFDLRYVQGHIEVFYHGVFQFSADTIGEAIGILSDE